MLQLTGWDDPPGIDPLPVDLVSGAEGRMPISVSSLKCSPLALTSTVTFPIPIVGDAASLNSARPSLLAPMLIDCSWSATECRGPLSLQLDIGASTGGRCIADSHGEGHGVAGAHEPG